MTPRRVRAVLLALVPLAAAGGLVAALAPWRTDPTPPASPAVLPARLGGITTAFVDGDGAFGVVARGLTAEELGRFADGRAVFDRVVGIDDGLDADALADSCAGCHPRHGRSVDPLGRVAPPLIGLGLLEAVPAQTLAAAADPDDRDGDGITGEVGPGRFGWKAAQPTVASQVAHALEADFGVTLDEITPEDLDALVFYTELLAVPARRGGADAAARAGAALFDAVGCAACHTPSVRTGDDAVPALREQVIWPYTDLLLHDLGEGEYRTAPLWGFGRLDDVGDVVLLHDGRARTLDEAIAAHGGEASGVRDRWRALDDAERTALAAFLAGL